MPNRTTRHELALAILHLLEQKKSPEAAAKDIAHYLVRERRTKELDSLMRDVMRLRYEHGGPLEVIATSASPLTESVKHAVAVRLQAPAVLIDEVRDEAVVGGVRVETYDRRQDLTIHGRLQLLKANPRKG